MTGLLMLAHDGQLIHGFAALSEAYGYILLGMSVGIVVGGMAGLLRKWRR